MILLKVRYHQVQVKLKRRLVELYLEGSVVLSKLQHHYVPLEVDGWLVEL